MTEGSDNGAAALAEHPARPLLGAPKKVLVVDDEPETAGGLADILREDGYHVDVVHSAEDAVEKFKADTYHLLLTDLLLPGKSGVELTKIVHDAAPATAIVLITGHATVKTAVSALKRGASDYIRKPVNPKKLRERVQSLLEGRPDYLPNKMLAVGRSGVVVFEGMMARSRVMHNVFEKIKLAAQSDATVLITGESGTGKELVARAIHMRSKRAQGPFIAVHTGAIPRELIASELFGHERGSFTGAVDNKEGKFELADGGTIFLDEISTMDERTQINLLRVLESFAYMRIGGKKERQANVRVVAATNRDLMQMSEENQFREDLYYRLNILQINAAAGARAPRRRGALGDRVHGALRGPLSQADAGRARRDAAAARGLPLAGQRPRAAQRHRAGRPAGARAVARSRALAADDLPRRAGRKTSFAFRSAPRCATPRRRSSCARSKRAKATRRSPPRCSASRAARSTTSWPNTASTANERDDDRRARGRSRRARR